MGSSALLWLTQYHYTRRLTVGGVVQSAAEPLRIYPRQAGVVAKRWVAEGGRVAQGAVLFELDGERHSATRPVEQQLAQLLDERLVLLARDGGERRQLVAAQADDLRARLMRSDDEIASARQELALQQRRTQLAADALARHRALAAEGFVSVLQVQQKEEEQLDAARLGATLARTLQGLEKERQALAGQLAALPLQQAAGQAELGRERNVLRQQQAENAARRTLSVLAPVAATVSTLTAQPGQYVTPQQPLATLLPAGAPLEVQLFAPSKAIGFVRAGARVKLRYEAFPYQKFGHADGVVNAVSRTPLLPGEVQGMPESREPLYRIKVRLAKPYVLAYGKPTPLVPGMRLEADVMLETRPLYEWALEPLYSVTGRW